MPLVFGRFSARGAQKKRHQELFVKTPYRSQLPKKKKVDEKTGP
jgi:hypothetical protein